MEGRLAGYDVSYDPAPAEDDEYAPSHYLPSPEQDPAEVIEQMDFADASHASLKLAIDALDQRSRRIVESRWLTEKKATLHELAAEYDVSAERIRQIEAAAISKLRAAMAA